MTPRFVYIAAAGIISPLGCGLDETEAALRADRSAIAPLRYLLQPQTLPLQHVLSNSFGFGGSNCSLVLSRVGGGA